MKIRALAVAVLMLVTAAYLGTAARAEPTPIRRSLSELPFSIETWRGTAAPPFSSEVLEQLRVDDYTMRTYSRAGGGVVGLYVGYYATQRQGASIHSPLNCLPGAGWVPTQKSYESVIVPTDKGGSRTVQLNRIVIEKGLDRQLVLYWYQSHGRVVASEYWGKMYSVLDAIRINRTDAALVRIVVPVDSKVGVEEADQRATEFTRALFPLLGNFLPS
jgi:EpsI family protein